MSILELAEMICNRIPEDRRPTVQEIISEVENFVDRVIEMKPRDQP